MRVNVFGFLAATAMCAGLSMSSSAAAPEAYLLSLQKASNDKESCAAMAQDFVRRNPANAREIVLYANKLCKVNLGVPGNASVVSAASATSLRGNRVLVVKDSAQKFAAGQQAALPASVKEGLSGVLSSPEQCLARSLEYARSNPSLAMAVYAYVDRNCGADVSSDLAERLATLYPQRYALADGSVYGDTSAVATANRVRIPAELVKLNPATGGVAVKRDLLPTLAVDIRKDIEAAADASPSACASRAMGHVRKNPSSGMAIYQFVSRTCGAEAAATLAASMARVYPKQYALVDGTSYSASDMPATASVPAAIRSDISKAWNGGTGNGATECSKTTLRHAKANPDKAEAIAGYASATCGKAVVPTVAAGLAMLYPGQFDGTSLKSMGKPSSVASGRGFDEIAEPGATPQPLTRDAKQTRLQAELDAARRKYNLSAVIAGDILRTRGDSDECVDATLDQAEENPSLAGSIASYALSICNAEEVASPIAVGLAKMYPNGIVPIVTAMSRQAPALYGEILLAAVSVFPSECRINDPLRQVPALCRSQVFDRMVEALKAELPDLAGQLPTGDITLPGDAFIPGEDPDKAGLPQPDEISPN
jgi:hypothetical protein